MVISESQIVGLLAEVGRIGLWLQTIGLIIVIWIVFQVILIILNKKNRNTLKDLKEDINRLEKKIDKLIRR